MKFMPRRRLVGRKALVTPLSLLTFVPMLDMSKPHENWHSLRPIIGKVVKYPDRSTEKADAALNCSPVVVS